MKSIFSKSFLALVLFSGFALMFLTECTKDKSEITAIITVKARWDTLRVIPFADVVIGKDFDDVKVAGKADASGEFKATFKLEAILDVVATKDTSPAGGPYAQELRGTAVVRLKPGDVVRKTVFIR
jgi:hypothetical protein